MLIIASYTSRGDIRAYALHLANGGTDRDFKKKYGHDNRRMDALKAEIARYVRAIGTARQEEPVDDGDPEILEDFADAGKWRKWP